MHRPPVITWLHRPTRSEISNWDMRHKSVSHKRMNLSGTYAVASPSAVFFAIANNGFWIVGSRRHFRQPPQSSWQNACQLVDRVCMSLLFICIFKIIDSLLHNEGSWVRRLFNYRLLGKCYYFRAFIVLLIRSSYWPWQWRYLSMKRLKMDLVCIP